MEERVAGRHDLTDGQMTTVLVGGKKVLLAKVDGQFYATTARCPHWGGPLPEGTLHGHHLLCPLHKGTFDVRSGDLLEPPPLDGIAAFRVRVEGDDVYVDRSEEPKRGRTMPMYACDLGVDAREFVIIGAGAAAAAAAEALRQECFVGRILLISPEDRWPYDRPNLSKDYMAGELEAKWLPLRSPEFYEEHTIERVVGRVTRLDVSSRAITLDDGSALQPDAVLVASGARPRRLDLPGAELPGVFTLRSLEDAERLAEAAGGARRAVVIGASFIGMETAASLVRRGLEVTVVGPETTPFERILGPEVGRVVQARHAAHGTRFALGGGVARFTGDSAIRTVELDDGVSLEADLVVVGVGVQPATDFVTGIELDRDGGVPVDDRAGCRTRRVGGRRRSSLPRAAHRPRRAHRALAAGRAARPRRRARHGGKGREVRRRPLLLDAALRPRARLRRRRPGMGGGHGGGRPRGRRLHGLLCRPGRAAGRLRYAAGRDRRLRGAHAHRGAAGRR